MLPKYSCRPAAVADDLSWLRRYAGVLAADNVSTAARDAGLHRSTIYERLSQLRSSATAAGLHEYFGSIPTALPQRR